MVGAGVAHVRWEFEPVPLAAPVIRHVAFDQGSDDLGSTLQRMAGLPPSVSLSSVYNATMYLDMYAQPGYTLSRKEAEIAKGTDHGHGLPMRALWA